MLIEERRVYLSLGRVAAGGREDGMGGKLEARQLKQSRIYERVFFSGLLISTCTDTGPTAGVGRREGGAYSGEARPSSSPGLSHQCYLYGHAKLALRLFCFVFERY